LPNESAQSPAACAAVRARCKQNAQPEENPFMRTGVLILVFSSDAYWRERVLHNFPKEINFAFRGELEPSEKIQSSHADLILIDDALIPPVESSEMTRIRKTLKGISFFAVYSPSTKPKLQDVRKSFVAGALDLVEKPYTVDDIARIFKSVEFTRPIARPA
jgi:hypothetical protein